LNIIIEWIIAVALFFAFWAGIWFARRRLPKSFQVYPLAIMWRTTRFNDLIDLIGRSHKTVWKAIWDVGIAISLGGMIFIFYTLLQNLYYLIFRPQSAAPVSLLIPGITLSLDFTTLLFVAASLALIIVFHELSHGIASRAEGLKVKSTGLLLAAIIPGAFVEPDEEDLKKAKKSTQARVYAAGSATNIWMAVVVIALLANTTAILYPFYQPTPSGIVIVGDVPNSPASGVLQPGDVILSINGSSITNNVVLTQVLGETTPNSTVPMTILRDGTQMHIDFKLGYNSATNLSFIGISPFYNYYAPRSPLYSTTFPYYFFDFLSWLELLSLNIGLINMLPVPVFDGGHIASIVSRFGLRSDKRGDWFANALMLLALAILVLNILLSFYFFPNFRLG